MTAVVYATNQAGPDQICVHLKDCDACFTPRLSACVDLADYAGKLAGLAERFEAWQDGRLIGLVALYCNDPAKKTAHVSNVSVNPALTRRGIARNLLDAALSEAGSRGFSWVSLEVDQHSDAALGLYSSMGFSSVGRVATTITMGRTLNGNQS